jgi:3-hydroxyisobutyrate dehydrogenase-like beta-hydroxyacid dehydrogenase
MAAEVEGGLPSVAVVGLGHMGLAIAERLIDAGYPVAVANRTPGRDTELVERGATRLDSAAAALVHAEICVTSLADDSAVRAAILGDGGILHAAGAGSTLVEMSTISVAASVEVAEGAAEAGVEYLRAPLSGNPAAVRSGSAACFVSGPAEESARHEQLLRAIAPAVRYLGEGEQARVAKLVLQVLIGGTTELLAEALLLGESSGLDRSTLLEVIGTSVIGSKFVEYKSEPLIRDDYSSTFTTDMMRKDVELVLDLAGETGVELPFTNELRSLLEETSEAGHGEDDFSALILRPNRRVEAPGPRRK